MDLKQLYHNPKFSASFSGQSRFTKAVKSINQNVSTQGVKQALRKIDSYTLHKPVRKPREYRRVYTKRIGYLYQIDLVDMSKFSRKNSGYKWLITCIDTFSKKAWVFKTKQKTATAIANALRGFLTKNVPEKIETDEGKEFYNRIFQKIINDLDITHYSIASVRKCSIVERFNRTIKTRMYRSFSARGTYKWIDVVQDLVDGYNNSVHRSIGITPNEVNKGNEAKVRKKLFPKVKRTKKKAKFKIGQSVRITRFKGPFEKGYEMTYTFEVYEIHSVKKTQPITYVLKDYDGEVLKGSFYDSEIQLVDKSDEIYPIEKIIRTRVRRGKKEYYVKWLGYSNRNNSWVEHQYLFKI